MSLPGKLLAPMALLVTVAAVFLAACSDVGPATSGTSVPSITPLPPAPIASTTSAPRDVAVSAPTLPPTTAPTQLPKSAPPPPAPTLSAVPPSTLPRTAADRYGVSFSGNEYDPLAPQALTLLGKTGVGIGWVRVEMSWFRIEVSPGRFDFSRYDSLLTSAGQQGFQVLGSLTYGSPWHTSAPASEPAGFARLTYPPSDYAAYEAYVTAVVSRYKNSIHAWEVWNEPDLTRFWKGTPADYARLLAAAHDTVKRADPSAQVVLGGLALCCPPDSSTNFLTEILRDTVHPAANNLDVVDVHLYGPKTEAKRRMDYVRGELAKVGAADRPIWVTEVGYSSDPGVQLERAYQGGPEAQAQWLRDTLPYLLNELGAQRVFWFTWIDVPTSGRTFAKHGLLDANLVPKPAVDAYKALIAGR